MQDASALDMELDSYMAARSGGGVREAASCAFTSAVSEAPARRRPGGTAPAICLKQMCPFLVLWPRMRRSKAQGPASFRPPPQQQGSFASGVLWMARVTYTLVQ